VGAPGHVATSFPATTCVDSQKGPSPTGPQSALTVVQWAKVPTGCRDTQEGPSTTGPQSTLMVVQWSKVPPGSQQFAYCSRLEIGLGDTGSRFTQPVRKGLGNPKPEPVQAAFRFFWYISHIIQLTPQQQSAESRNSAGAEALAVARRPKEASREKTRPPPVSRGASP